MEKNDLICLSTCSWVTLRQDPLEAVLVIFARSFLVFILFESS